MVGGKANGGLYGETNHLFGPIPHPMMMMMMSVARTAQKKAALFSGVDLKTLWGLVLSRFRHFRRIKSPKGRKQGYAIGREKNGTDLVGLANGKMGRRERQRREEMGREKGTEVGGLFCG
jgi:hypothetical protein